MGLGTVRNDWLLLLEVGRLGAHGGDKSPRIVPIYREISLLGELKQIDNETERDGRETSYWPQGMGGCSQGAYSNYCEMPAFPRC